jgi:hypothetical protein
MDSGVKMNSRVQKMTDRKLHKEWVEALRSGKYIQGQTALRRDDKFCCLGVLCDITKSGDWTRKPGSSNLVYGDEFEVSEITLPFTVRGKSGLSFSPSVLVYDDFTDMIGRKDLAELNDAGYTFEQIAGLIEEQL